MVGFAALRDLGHVVRLRSRSRPDSVRAGRTCCLPGSGAPSTYDSDELTNYEIGLRTGYGGRASSRSTSQGSILDWKRHPAVPGRERVRRQCEWRQGEEPGPGTHGDSAGGPGLHDLSSTALTPMPTSARTPIRPWAATMAIRCPGCRTCSSDWAPDTSGPSATRLPTSAALIAYAGERMTDFGNLTPGGQHQHRRRLTTTVDLRTGLEMGTLVRRALRQELWASKQGHHRLHPAGPVPGWSRRIRHDPAAHDRLLRSARGSDGPTEQGRRLVGSPHFQRP